MSNLKSELLHLAANREKDLLAEIGRLSLQLRTAELQAHTLQAKLSDLEADGTIDHMGRKLPLPGHHADCEELAEKIKEIERLKALIPPDDTSFLGKAWSLIAEKLRLERDALCEELAEKKKEIEWLRGERPDVVAWLQRMARNARHWGGKNDDRAEIYDRLADVFECGEHRKESTDQFGRTLPLEGHHKDCGHGKDGWSMCTCDKLRNRDARQFRELMNEVDTSTLTTSHVSNPKCSKCGDTGLVQVAPNARGVKQCDCAKERPSPLAESVTRAFQQSAADAVRTTLDRGGTAVGEVQGQWQVVSKTCDHGNTECKRCGVGQPTRDPRQDLKAGEHVRFEIEGIIKERQSAGIFQDEDGSDFEPIQYAVKDSINGMTYYVGYHQIINVIGKEK